MNDYKLVKNIEWKEVEINGEVREIPNFWFANILDNLCLKIKDGTHNSFQNYDGKDYRLLLSAKNIKKNNLFLSQNERKISLKNYNEITKNGFPQKNDVLMTIVGTIGELMIWKNEDSEAFQRSVSFLRVNEKLMSNFLYFCLKSSYVKEEIEIRTKIGAQPGIYLNDLKSLPIFTPPLNQQSAIADILSAQEAIISDIESLITKYESRFQYLSEELLSGKLRVKEVEGQIILYKNAEDNWKEVAINGEMKEIPCDWNVKKISDLAKIIAGQSPDTQYINDNDGIDFHQGNSLFSDQYIKKSNKKIATNNAKKIAPANSILISVRAPVGELNINQEEIAIGRGLAALSPKINQNLLLNILRFYNNEITGLGNGSTFEGMKISEFSDFQVALNLENQSLIASILQKQEDVIVRQKEFLFKEKQKLDWLLDNLLSGKYLIK